MEKIIEEIKMNSIHNENSKTTDKEIIKKELKKIGYT